ncbi:kinase-like protein [Gigaspora margarita]|uniref:Kinase-like protein n=1 Tax=Gigaspora margarita TaxID=4874 RepID=A0A8H4AFB2_GIGMA|nr:kinase-like protein [Gigaspora margarita]
MKKIKISIDIACGLGYLHENDIIHRDLNTKSILINNEKAQISNPVFLELNLDSSSSISLQEGMIGFTDPELLKDLNLQFTKSSDVYSLGMVMWSITSERLPFENYTNQTTLVNSIVSQNMREDPIKDTPQEYVELYGKCWNLNSKERPTAQEVYDKLSQFEINLREPQNINGEKNVNAEEKNVNAEEKNVNAEENTDVEQIIHVEQNMNSEQNMNKEQNINALDAITTIEQNILGDSPNNQNQGPEKIPKALNKG